MQNKAQMSMTKLGLLLLGLTIIWVMCNRAELQFQNRFEDDVKARMGGHSIDKTQLKLAIEIRQNKTKELVTQSTNELESIFKQKYNLTKTQQQQLICVLVRDFDTKENQDNDFLTVKSIVKQLYQNYHIIYMSEEGDNSVQKIQTYLNVNQILSDRRSFVTAKADTVQELFKAVEKCPKNGIMLMMETGESLITPSVLKVINTNFKPDVELAWASSLYANDKVGFSFELSDKIKASKEFRKYPLAMNDVITFRIELFFKARQSFMDYRLYYPLYIPESYGFTFLSKAKNFKYLPDILSIKNREIKLRVERTQVQKDIQDLIRQDKSIIELLKSLANKK